MAGENPRTWGAPAGRALLPTAGCAQIVASRGAERSPRGEQEAQGVEAAASDSLHGSDPGGGVAGYCADRAPLPHQPTVVDVQRVRHRGAQQRRSSGSERPARAEEETDRNPRTEQELQSPSEELVQECRGYRLDQARPVPGVLRGFSSQGHAAGNGQTDLSQKNCHDRFDRLEERRVLRRPSSETTNSLSVSDRVRSNAGNLLQRWPSGPRDTLVRERVSEMSVRRCVPRARSLRQYPRPSRITRKSYGPRVPDRTMVATERRSALLVSELNRLRRQQAMTTARREILPNLWAPCPGTERMVWPVKTYPAQSTGLESKNISSGGESVFLDFPFYRTDISNLVPRNFRIAGNPSKTAVW